MEGIVYCIVNVCVLSHQMCLFRANLNHELPVKKAKPVIQDATQIRNATVRQHVW